MAPTVPHPRSAPPGGGIAQWYEHELGWATVTAPGEPVLLRTGLSFDVLELPAAAGAAVLRRVGPTGPVALLGRQMWLFVAAGSADEVPSLLEWLEWGSVALDLRAIGTGGLIAAPAPPGTTRPATGGAARWLRPPAPGRDGEQSLPVFAGIGGCGTAPDLVRLVAAAATECHRTRLINVNTGPSTGLPKERRAQPLAFS